MKLKIIICLLVNSNCLLLFAFCVFAGGYSVSTPKLGASIDINSDLNQYELSYQTQHQGYIFEFSYFDQDFIKTKCYQKRDLTFPPLYINENYKNSYISFAGGYNNIVLKYKNKVFVNLPSLVYSGFGSAVQKTQNRPDGYFETQDLSNNSYIVFGIKTGIGLEYRLSNSYTLSLINMIDYESDGLRKLSQEIKGSKLNLINPFISFNYFL